MPKRKSLFVIEIPTLYFPWEKPIYNEEFYDKVRERLFKPSTTARYKYIVRYYLKPAGISVAYFGLMAYLLVGITRSLPPLHNWEVKRAYEKRHERHLQYLKDNPKYKAALMTAYKKLAPDN